MSPFFIQLNAVMFWALMAVVCGGGAAAFVFGTVRLRRAMLVSSTPTSNLRSAAQGFGEFEGRAELLPGPPIVAPLTGTVCVWYRCQVYEQQRDGRAEWGLLTDETSDGLFLLRDYSGSSIVDPEGAVVNPSTTLSWYTNSLMTGPPPSVGSALFGRYRCREERIELRSRLYVMGHFSTQGSAQEVPDTPAEARALLNLWKRDQGGLLQRFDANRDGVIGGHEWDAVRRAAVEEVLRQQRERFGEGTANVISRPADGRAFIISTAGEEQLLQHWRAEALLAYTVFASAVWLAAWAFSSRF